MGSKTTYYNITLPVTFTLPVTVNIVANSKREAIKQVLREIATKNLEDLLEDNPEFKELLYQQNHRAVINFYKVVEDE